MYINSIWIHAFINLQSIINNLHKRPFKTTCPSSWHKVTWTPCNPECINISNYMRSSPSKSPSKCIMCTSAKDPMKHTAINIRPNLQLFAVKSQHLAVLPSDPTASAHSMELAFDISLSNLKIKHVIHGWWLTDNTLWFWYVATSVFVYGNHILGWPEECLATA